MKPTILLSCVSAIIVGLSSGCKKTHAPVLEGLNSAFVDMKAGDNPSGMSENEIQQASRLYRLKCRKCHRLYDPSDYNDAEWKSWMNSMSDDAHLNQAEHRLLSRYLDIARQAASKHR